MKRSIKKVGISGANGRMGRLTIKVIDASADLEVGGLYAPGRDNQKIDDYILSGNRSTLENCDVIIELTHPEASDENVPVWKDFGANVVIGTSGYDTPRIEMLKRWWENYDSRCLVVPNFSIGAVLMMYFAELAAPHFESSEIIEMHHFDKPDAPSGTSLETARRMSEARNQTLHDRGVESVPGALGACVEDIPVHSLRVHGALAHQEVILGTTGQYLSIRHDTTKYEAFTQGVLLSLRRIESLSPGVTIGIDEMLGI
jgi:4-hydroxy-tetrahydrodipicolinate reductase